MSRDETTSTESPHKLPGEEAATILVVDDNPLMRNVLRGLLVANGYTVVEATHGEEAAALVKKQPFDLIICDIIMPKMGGFELHQLVRSDPEANHIPFVFLSALDHQDEIRHGKELGADDYLCKPFEPRDLLAVIRGKVARWRLLNSQVNTRFEGYQRRVIQTLSHEFRTPLVAINTGMELLLNHRESLGTDRAKRLLEAVQRGGVRLEKLVGDFMVLQQLGAGVMKSTFDSCAEPLSVEHLLQRHGDIRDEDLAGEGFVVVRTDHSGRAKILGVEAYVIDCLDRLVSNAAKFSPGRKEIEIHVRLVEGEVWFDVKDRGSGIDLSRIREAIQPFGQINRGKLEQQGGGLGLSIAHHYALIHGARLEFAVREDGGSIVSLVVPQSSIDEKTC
jgi:two-component system sensor histidine kinase/response regulator